FRTGHAAGKACRSLRRDVHATGTGRRCLPPGRSIRRDMALAAQRSCFMHCVLLTDYHCSAYPDRRYFMLEHYGKKILSARVYDVAIESPLQAAPLISRRIGNQVLLKREDLQPVFSFKLRGAYNKVAMLTPEQQQKGVICASAGNHAQGLALAAA